MTQTILLPVDGSEHALHAVDWLIRQLPEWANSPTVHLITVQPSLHGDISRFVSTAQLQEYHRDEGEKCLAPARARLQAAGLTPTSHVRVGESAQVICAAATELGCDQVIIGTRGHSGLAGLLLGSVATKLAKLSPVPVTLVR